MSYIYIYTYIHVYIYMNIYLYTCIHTRKQMSTRTRAHTHTTLIEGGCIYIYIYIYYILIRTKKCAHAHVNIHTTSTKILESVSWRTPQLFMHKQTIRARAAQDHTRIHTRHVQRTEKSQHFGEHQGCFA